MGWQEKINAAKKAERMRQMIAMEPPPIRYIFLLVLLLLLLGTSFAENWTIDGGRVYWGNANAEISVYPAFSNNLINHVQYANFSWNGTPITVNVSFLFDKPISYGRVDLWQNVTREYLVEQPARVNYSYRVDNVTGYAPSTNPCDLGDLQNALRYLVNYTQNGTPMQGVACFNSFSNISNNYTLIYSLNGTIFVPQNQTRPEWTDISGLFSEWRNESYPNYRAYTINNVAFTNPTLYQTRLTYETPLNLSSGKYSIYIHAGSPLDVVNGFAPVYLELDPWWNNTWTTSLRCSFNSTVNSTLVNFPIPCKFNTSDSTIWNTTTCTNTRAISSNNSTLLRYDLDSVNATYCGNASNNATFFVFANVTPSNLGLTSIFFYLGNVNASSGEDAVVGWRTAGAVGVYHYDQIVGKSFMDSAAYNNLTFSALGCTLRNGYRYGAAFDNTDPACYNLTAKNPIGMPSGRNGSTETAWINWTGGTTNGYATLYAMENGASGAGRQATIYQHSAALRYSDGSDAFNSGLLPSPNMTQFYSTRYNGTAAQRYVRVGENSSSTIHPIVQTNVSFLEIGRTYQFDVSNLYVSDQITDETRFYNETKSDDWIIAEFKGVSSITGDFSFFSSYESPTPADGAHVLTYQNLTVNVTHADLYDTATLFVNNSSAAWNYSMAPTSSTTNLVTVTLARGNYTFSVFVYNSTSAENNSLPSRLLFMDNTLPSMPNLTLPQNYTNYTQDYFNATWNASADFDGDAIQYSICTGAANPPTTCVNVSSLTTILPATNATIFWMVCAHDGLNCSNFTEIWQTNLTEDLPQVNITTANGSSFVMNAVTINFILNDSSLVNCSYDVLRLGGGAAEINTSISCSATSVTFATLAADNYTTRIWASHYFSDFAIRSVNYNTTAVLIGSPGGGGGGGAPSVPPGNVTNVTIFQVAPPRPVNFAGIPFTGELDCFFKGMTRLFSANIPNYWLWVTAPYVLYLLVNISLASLSGKGLFLGAIDYGIFIIWMAGLINYFPPQVMC